MPTRSSTDVLEPTLAPDDVPTEVPQSSPVPTVVSGPQRIEFEPGATLWRMQIMREPGAADRFVLRASEGQTMQISALPFVSLFTIVGADEVKLHQIRSFFWRGQVPSTQDYFIDLDLSSFLTCSVCESFTLTVAIAPLGQESQSFDYIDEEIGFKLTYSDYFVIDPDQPFGLIESDLSLFLVEPEYYDETNLGEAYFFITASEEPEEIATCTTYGPPIKDEGKVEINNVVYQWVNQPEGGAGNIWDSTTFMTVYNDTCFHVIFFLHSHAADLYDPPLSEFDVEGVIARFEEIFQSLVLLDM
jgi:hypothetical protein